jgi:pimeloyl-ACP methyl ester carboxylesterase
LMMSSSDASTSTTRRRVSAPSKRLFLREQSAVFEMGALLASSPLLRCVGRGDSHPVLVMPGFTAGDASTVALRSLIRSWGYWAHGWGLGTNYGPTKAIRSGIHDRLDALHSRHGAKVTIIGWSLGGLYARELARDMPDKVRQVITLGSPIQMTPDDRSNASAISERLQKHFDPNWHWQADHEQELLPVPSTSIYTRTDGVVRWQLCLDVVDDQHDNVEVKASHIGLGFNPSALLVIADRLNRREGAWRPFRPLPGLGGLYPKAESFEPAHPHRERRRPRRAATGKAA